MTDQKMYWWTSSSGRVEFRIPEQAIHDVCHSGPNDEAVAYWVAQHDWSDEDHDAIREELSEYGAWEHYELKDDEANRERIFWIACWDIFEQDESERDCSEPVEDGE